MLLGLEFDAWITLVTAIAMMAALLFTRLRSDVIFLGAVCILFVTGVLDTSEAFSGFVNSSVIIVGIMFVIVTGLSAEGVLALCGSHPIIVMIALCLMAAFVTEFVSNSAAIALMFPVVYDAAMGIGCNPLPFAIALLLAVNAAFLTPISTPLNLLVYGPGGYRATDYLRIGLLVKLAYLIRLQKGLNIVVLDFTSATQPSCSEGRRHEGPWR